MADAIIVVENVSKRYQLGQSADDRYATLRDVITNQARAFVRRTRRNDGNRATGEFWALRDVSFGVQAGEVVGIIGRNGAGKSTLLKILSRITEPTEGRVRIRGRVASLLEVGTGFHPELTGRENIYLNGAILGMSRAEIRSKFDEIVAFAEVERFLGTPVKRYSSGMYIRLAFAVAAHLEPEILIVDEVLAVGDAAFQRKCLDKMEDVGHQGKTVLFVSHNMPAMTRLCGRAVMLTDGQVVADGLTHSVVAAYLSSGVGTKAERSWPTESAPGDDVARLRVVRVVNEDGVTTEALDIRRLIGVEIEFDVLAANRVLVPNFGIRNEDGVIVCHPHDWQSDWRGRVRPLGRHKRVAWIPRNFMAEGTFFIDVQISSYDPVVTHCLERQAVAFQVVDTRDGDSARGDYAGPFPGVVRPILRWSDRTIPPVSVTT
jgi:lipopolysaccharide transport system ATP-binding protein